MGLDGILTPENMRMVWEQTEIYRHYISSCGTPQKQRHAKARTNSSFFLQKNSKAINAPFCQMKADCWAVFDKLWKPQKKNFPKHTRCRLEKEDTTLEIEVEKVLWKFLGGIGVYLRPKMAVEVRVWPPLPNFQNKKKINNIIEAIGKQKAENHFLLWKFFRFQSLPNLSKTNRRQFRLWWVQFPPKPPPADN